ncbi:sporulation-specific N-acetylglucosaminidase [Gracilibacillus halophilus YIM-C55.5]|uniref:Sporulation-specific N-acetylglucosaminidase n=1 Tax=Gracilibacillus halophilus YIM-C55.5 TaxID=1308866 RepID=N4WDY6_9BACI|nr:glycoside hydrolase family 18 protein [Gracilibacillus halophilus]ENH98473.1 sporulation-specific N-acetylglucosaminidase [Gracilibacillus halophilus YIM-C55.5]
MEIYVVQQGDSLYSIANQYGITYNTIASANEINPENSLVVGQTLVIPIYGDFYTVQAGDSLYSISQRFGLTASELANVNQINMYQPLSIGTRLYIPERAKPTIEVNAYAEPTGDSVSDTLENAVRKHANQLTYLAPFSYRVTREGNLTPPPLNQFASITNQANTVRMLVVTNLEEGGFSQELGRIIVTNEDVQNRLLDEIVRVANQQGYGDVHFDFEFLPADTRQNYNAFLRKAKQRLQENNLMLSTALAPKTSAEQEGQWYEAHDYQAHGDIVDFVVLMTYEWGYSGGPPRAVSPIGPVTDVVNYALTEMPASKILLGQNLYGYDWTLPYEPGGDIAEAVSPQRAVQLAREYNQTIEFDEEAQAPFFFYTDAEGNRHEVWFEDARSIQAKFDLIKEKNLRGISYWKLGLAFPQNWLLLDDNFTIEKKEME